MSESHTKKEQQESGSESTQDSGNNQGSLGYVPYFTESVEISAYEGCFIASSPVKMAGNHEPPLRRGEDITGLSKNSRLRLIKHLATLYWKSYRSAVFTTLTYHNDYPQTGKELKVELDKFIKRMERSFPKLDFVWRLELQKRGAPHFHFMYFIRKEDLPYDERHILEDIQEHWHSLNPCGCSDCIEHGVKSETIDNFGKCIAYISKYVAKETVGQEKNYTGRRWGYNRQLQFKVLEKFKISGIQFIYLKLLLISAYASNEKRRAYITDNLKNIYSLFVLTDADVLRSCLATVISTDIRDAFQFVRSAGALPFDFEFPASNSKLSRQLNLGNHR